MKSLLAALMLAGLLPFGGEKEALPFPVEAEGNIRFILDAARFPGDATTPLEIYLSIPQENLAESADSAGYAEIAAAIRLENGGGDGVGDLVDGIWIPLAIPAEEDPALPARHLMTLRPDPYRASWRVHVMVTDRNGGKGADPPQARTERPWGEAWGRLDRGTLHRTLPWDDPAPGEIEVSLSGRRVVQSEVHGEGSISGDSDDPDSSSVGSRRVRIELPFLFTTPDGTARASALLNLRIATEKLGRSSESGDLARLEVKVSVQDLLGEEIGRAEWDAHVSRSVDGMSAATRLKDRTISIRPLSLAETERVGVRLFDLHGSKRGLLDRARGKKPSGSARGRFELAAARCGISDPVFGWDLDRSQAHAGLPARTRLLPNPPRYYGLYHTRLLLYAEEYGGPGWIRCEIAREADGRNVWEGTDTAGTGGAPVVPHLMVVDLSSIAAGEYRVTLSKGGGAECRSTGTFEVLWEIESWAQDQKNLLQEAYVLLNPTEYERVREMSRGEVEVYMRGLWNRHDPNPETAANELRERFRERVDHANRFFATAIREGLLSDRGRVHIRFGPPDEVTKELNPQDQRVLSNVLSSEVSADRYDQVRGSIPRNVRDDRAYEIWTYTVRGDPLLSDLEVPGQHAGLKFIFVDELGYGDMRLIYTNLSGAF